MQLAPVKVAVVGVGALGEHHARIYSELPLADLIAVVDLREERARQFADRYRCRGCCDYQEILGAVQAVSLAVPTRQHARIAMDLLNRGIHVLVEKPIAQSAQEADRMIQAQRRGGAVLHVGQTERFNPAWLAVRPHVRRPLFFEGHRLGVFVPRSLDIDVVLDLMIHDLDLVLHLTGSPIREIRAVGIPVLTQRVDIANARLEFENGCVANLTASRVSTEKVRKLRFFQPAGYVSIDFQSQRVERHGVATEGEGRRIVEQRLEVERQEPLRLEIEAFLRAVRGQENRPGALPCTPEEGKRALALALEINATIARQRQGAPNAGSRQ